MVAALSVPDACNALNAEPHLAPKDFAKPSPWPLGPGRHPVATTSLFFVKQLQPAWLQHSQSPHHLPSPAPEEAQTRKGLSPAGEKELGMCSCVQTRPPPSPLTLQWARGLLAWPRRPELLKVST